MGKDKKAKQPLGNQISETPQTGWGLDRKLIALSFLDSTQREHDGRMIPKYLEVSREMDIPESTLRHWWLKRDEIKRLADTTIAEYPKATAVRLAGHMNMILEELERRGYKDVSARDLGTFFDKFASKFFKRKKSIQLFTP